MRGVHLLPIPGRPTLMSDNDTSDTAWPIVPLYKVRLPSPTYLICTPQKQSIYSRENWVTKTILCSSYTLLIIIKLCSCNQLTVSYTQQTSLAILYAQYTNTSIKFKTIFYSLCASLAIITHTSLINSLAKPHSP